MPTLRPRSRLPRKPAIEALEPRELLATLTFVVNNVNDSGPGSLRLALLNARSTTSATTPNLSRIVFEIPGSAVHSVVPDSPLPALPDFTTVDGSTEPGYAGRPVVEIDGSQAGADAEGLVVHTGSEVLDLAVSGFSGDQVVLDGDGSVLQGDYLGLDASGQAASGPVGAGVSLLGATDSLIGGPSAGQGNVIAGGRWGIFGSGARSDTFFGNIIGLDPTQSKPLGNSVAGVLLLSSSSNSVGGTGSGEGNVIAASPIGIELSSASGSSGNRGEVIAGNYLGESSLAFPFSNSAHDLDLDFNTQGTIVEFNAIEPVASGSPSATELSLVRDVNHTTTYTDNAGFDPAQHSVDVGVSLQGFVPTEVVNGQAALLQTFQGDIVVANEGTSAATGVVLEVDLLPQAGTRNPTASFYASGYQLSQGSVAGGFAQGQALYFVNLGTIAAGATADLHLVCTEYPSIGTYSGSIEATLSSDGIDLDSGDKQAST